MYQLKRTQQERESEEKSYLEMGSLMTEKERREFLEREATLYLGRKRNPSFLSQESLDSLSNEDLSHILRYFR